MTILGVDPGTRIMGYGILQTAPQPCVLAMDVIYLRNVADYKERIQIIFDTMCDICDRYRPDHLSIEAPFYGQNVQSMLKLGRAQGVAIAAAMSRHVPYTEYEPASIKQYITGNGRASKEQVLTMLQSHLDVELHARYLDATDALAAAYCHHLAVSHPLGDLRETLKPRRQRKSAKQSWADFVNQNPDRID